jgi:hypothetical protein
MSMSSRELLRRLQRDGWVMKDLGIGLGRKLLIQAGIESSAQ